MPIPDQYFISDVRPSETRFERVETPTARFSLPSTEKVVEGPSTVRKPNGGLWTSHDTEEFGWVEWAKKNDWYSSEYTKWEMKFDKSNVRVYKE
jgi:hypothetical protein